MAKKSLSDILREEMNPENAKDSNSSAIEIDLSKKNEVLTDLAVTNEEITKLTAELASQKNENKTLKNQLEKANQLQPQLEEQKSLVKKLTTDLKQANNYQKALAIATEKVEIMTEQIKSLKILEQELAEQKALVTKLYGELQQAENKPIETPKSVKLAVKSAPSAIVPAHRIGHYVAPAQTPVTLSDEVIGWFD